MGFSTHSDTQLNIRITRGSRRTITIRVLPDGTVEVKAPRFVSRASILSFVDSKRCWIEKKLAQTAQQQAELRDTPPLSDAELKELQKKARRVFADRAAYYGPIVGTDYGKITVRRQHSRFGSCSVKGNLNFNLALLLAPPEVLDYVVVHELCHRLEMNHSSRFWNLVEGVLPDYKRSKRWLKEHGSVILARICPAKER